MTEPAPSPPPRQPRGRRAWFVVGGLGAFLVGLYVIGWFLTGDRIPAGTRVVGVGIGGLSADEAERRLELRLRQPLHEPMTLVAADEVYELDPAEAGLTLDVEQTVSDAGGGHTWNPISMVDRWLGDHGEVAPALEVDDTALASWVADLAGSANHPAVEPTVTFTATGAPEVEAPVIGFEVDQPATIDVILDSYWTTNADVPVAGEVLAPDVDDSELQKALAEVAEPATAGPVLLQLPGRSVRLAVREFAPALRLEVRDGELTPVVDPDALEAALARKAEQVGHEPIDATVELRAGRPIVVPAKPGVIIDADDVAEAIVPVLTLHGRARSIEVGQTAALPDFTTRDARALRIREPISDFVTYFPYAEYRNINQGRAAALINGTVLEPGELFSFNKTVGERTEENGFVVGFIISNGVFAEDLGGGVSQVVTTTYNAAFFAGLADVEHTPHSFYIDRYPMGREATVAWPDVDLKFRNTTPYGVLIEAWVVPSTPTTSGEMHVRMWSTKYWDIGARLSDQYDFTSSSTRYDPSDDCVPTTGYGGFDVDVTRVFRRTGSSDVVDTEVDHVSYIPLDTVICSPPPR